MWRCLIIEKLCNILKNNKKGHKFCRRFFLRKITNKVSKKKLGVKCYRCSYKWHLLSRIQKFVTSYLVKNGQSATKCFSRFFLHKMDKNLNTGNTVLIKAERLVLYDLYILWHSLLLAKLNAYMIFLSMQQNLFKDIWWNVLDDGASLRDLLRSLKLVRLLPISLFADFFSTVCDINFPSLNFQQFNIPPWKKGRFELRRKYAFNINNPLRFLVKC